MDINIAGVFYSKEEIAKRVKELAVEIEECFGDEDEFSAVFDFRHIKKCRKNIHQFCMKHFK